MVRVPLFGVALIVCGILAVSSASEYKIGEPKNFFLFVSGMIQALLGVIVCIIGGSL